MPNFYCNKLKRKKIFWFFLVVIAVCLLYLYKCLPVLLNGGHGGAMADFHGGFSKKHHRIAVAWRVWDGGRHSHGGRGGYGGVAENGVPPAPHTRTQPRHPQPHAHAAATTSGSDAPAQMAATSSGSDAPVTNGGLQREVLAEKTKLSRRRRRHRF